MAEPAAYVPATHEEAMHELRARLERETSHALFNRIEVALVQLGQGPLPAMVKATLDVLRSRAG